MGSALIWLSFFIGFCLVIQWVGVALALFALWRKPGKGLLPLPPVTVLRPICGLENFLEETLESTFQANYPTFELIFCAADPADPAVPLVQRLMTKYPQIAARLLTGDDKVSGNPKLNNLVKGWNAARYDYVLMSDSNVILPPDYLKRCMAEFTPETGLVSSPPIGIRAQNFWGRVECAFLNTFQARWQMASSALGNGFAQGKMLFWDARVLNAAGGIAVLGREMAEDVASTKTVRAAGKVVRLPVRFFEQPIGARQRSVVWSRQVRWAKVRRLGFMIYFLPELLAGAALPFLAVLVSVGLGAGLWVIPAFVALWYIPEYGLAAAGNWPRQPKDLAAWITRDALLPLLWLAAWRGNSFEWRGNAMTAEDVARSKGAK
ncbi:MAG: ceramide glucosyltransferase [Cypionkella sp.]